jgi:hypothetical protein
MVDMLVRKRLRFRTSILRHSFCNVEDLFMPIKQNPTTICIPVLTHDIRNPLLSELRSWRHPLLQINVNKCLYGPLLSTAPLVRSRIYGVCYLMLGCKIVTVIRDSWVGIATGYGLDGRGSITGRAGDFSLLHSVQTGSRAHSASHPMATGAWTWPLTSI